MRMMTRFLRTAKPAWHHCRCSSGGTRESLGRGDAGSTLEKMSPASAYTPASALAMLFVC